MGTGWRRAFCTMISDKEHKNGGSDYSSSPSPSPKCTKLSLFTTRSNPSTPRLDSQSPLVLDSKLTCKTKAETTTNSTIGNNSVDEGPKLKRRTASSTPSSPRSPLKLSILRNSLKFRNTCGICRNSARTGQGTAIYTAECGHTFHFPCIATYMRLPGHHLACPVCNTAWKDVPILTGCTKVVSCQDKVVQDKVVVELSPRGLKPDSEELKSPKVVDFRCYDDDEPLRSPTAGVRFVPIPEVDESVGEDDDEDVNDVEEFRGFFVNQNDSSCFEEQQQLNDKKALVDARILPECAVISSSRSHETRAVAIRVTAPRMNKSGRFGSVRYPAGRASIDLVAVLDVSGGMSGAKLQMLKRAMRLVISSLGSTDRLAIVAFSAVSKRLLPLTRMTAQGQRAARKIVDRLGCAQGTCVAVAEALRKASKVLEDRRERNPVASIMLFSDGQEDRAMTGDTNQRQGLCHVSSARFAHIEIPVHASGFGKKSGFSNDPAEDAFAKCVCGLLSVVARDMRIQLRFASGSAPAEITAVYSYSGRPTLLGSELVRLGDFYSEEERELLVELRVPASAMGSHHVLSVRCSYCDPATQEVIHGQDQRLLVPCPVRSMIPKIERFRSLFIASRAIAESRRLVDHDDYTSAHHLLGSARELLMQSGPGIAEEYVKALEAELSGVNWKRQQRMEEGKWIQRQRLKEREMVLLSMVDDNGEPLTPTSAWRAAEQLAKVAMMKKSLTRVSELHGFENARF